MKFRLLGPLEVLERDRVLRVGGGRGAGARGMTPTQSPIRFGWPMTVRRP
jgi:hypothetical protein